jgi:F-type H+-transporting ATPase subunit epsilon
VKLRILTPEARLFEGEAEECRLPGFGEEFSIMNFHQPGIFRLSRGPVRYAYRDGDRVRQAVLLIRGGIATVRGSELSLLIEKWK